jgi:hypothetical protein
VLAWELLRGLGADGHCYERAASIERWLQDSSLSPVTRQPIRGTLTRNLAMKAIIDARRA